MSLAEKANALLCEKETLNIIELLTFVILSCLHISMHHSEIQCSQKKTNMAQQKKKKYLKNDVHLLQGKFIVGSVKKRFLLK